MPTGRQLIYLVVVGLSVAGYYFLGYEVARHKQGPMVVWYCILFGSYIYLVRNESNLKLTLGLTVVFRLILLFSVPELSTDFYRFLWDGQLIVAGVNPYVHTPDVAAGMGLQISAELYNSLAYTTYHSMYAPVAQIPGIFAGWFAHDSIQSGAIIMRLFVLLAEVGSIYLILILLPVYRLAKERVLLYAANPLIIMELTGNLHHEAYVVFFLLLFLYGYEKRKTLPAAVGLAMATLSKLLPIIFLPLLVRRLGWRFLGFALIVGLLILVGFLPFWSPQLIYGHLDSGALYFNKLEFNGSVYFLVRGIGFWYKGYNIIQTAGFWLGISVFAGILLYALLERSEEVKLPVAMMWVWLMYIAFTTTLHPWYLIPLLVLAVFSNYRFPMVWSFFIFFTYLGYSQTGYDETPWIFLVEYGVTYGWMLYEVSIYARRNQMRLKLSGRKP